jgi:hypothetical protein
MNQDGNTYRVPGARVLLSGDHQLAGISIFLVSGGHGCWLVGCLVDCVWWWAARGWRSAGGKEAAKRICLGGWGGRSLCDSPPSPGAHALFSGGPAPAFGLFHIGKCPNSFSVCPSEYGCCTRCTRPCTECLWASSRSVTHRLLAAADHFWGLLV